MSHEQFLAAIPLEKDITMLTDVLADHLATEVPAAPLNLADASNLCTNLNRKLAAGSGDSRITDELATTCSNFYTALRTSLTNLRTTITADRDAL